MQLEQSKCKGQVRRAEFREVTRKIMQDLAGHRKNFGI